MAAVYRKTYPIDRPAGAEIIERRGKQLARWTNGKGQPRTAELLPDGRVRFVSDCWYVRYTDASGRMRRCSTGCRDKQSAQKMLADILADVEKVKAGVLSSAQMAAAGHLDAPIDKHVRDYLADLAGRTIRGRRVSPRHIANVRKQLQRVLDECGVRTLRDIDRRAVRRWMDRTASQPRDPDDADSPPLSARTVNMHRAAILAFCTWCVAERRLTAHPLAGLGKIEEAEPTRKRRALSEDEIARLLTAARERPLREALTVRRGKDKGKPLAKVRPEVRERLTRVGRERELLYRFLLTTGLRKGEVTSLGVEAVDLDGDPPCVRVEGRHAKSGRSAVLPLKPELAADLRCHLAQRNCDGGGSGKDSDNGDGNRNENGAGTGNRGSYGKSNGSGGYGKGNGHGSGSGEGRLFRVPSDFKRVFDADLAAAGIAKTDAHGHTLDIHCLRHTFATLLARRGVSPTVAQKLMRHSDIRLTMSVYTHLELSDTAEAVAALPEV